MTEKQSAPTLDDVANKAGVSTATVSRCLNSPHQVVETTREKVMAAVDELGYTPNFAARVMAAKRAYTVGAIIPTMENSIFAAGLQAFQESLHARGYTLLVASSAYKPDLEEEQIRSLVARGADGLLLIGHDRDQAMYHFLKRRNVPTLVTWSFNAAGQVPSVGFDNHRAMFEMTQEVIRTGHRRIAMISGISAHNDRARLRAKGFRAALANHGLSDDDCKILETTYSVESGANAFDALIRETPRPTAVLCGNDVLAVGALSRAKEHGLDVPGDVSITGFDDVEIARVVSPPLTTVHVPHREMGQRAAKTLIGMIEDQSPASSVQLNTSLRLRDTLAAPKGEGF